MKKEQPVYVIDKVKIKNDQLTVEYTEQFVDANYSNSVTKLSQQFVHGDLKYALNLLKPHVAAICEMPEAEKVDIDSPSEADINDTLKSYIVTGYSKGGSDDTEGVSIIAQKLLQSGQVLNITVPFTRYEDETGEGYKYGESLREVIKRCDYEVDAYLFEEKWGIKQESIDFDTPVESEITGEAPAPKKRGRKKKAEFVSVAEEVKEHEEFA